jgi:hypothetical protein
MEESTTSPTPKHIKVQLDEKTFIYVLDEASIDIWLEKYPDAKVVAD